MEYVIYSIEKTQIKENDSVIDALANYLGYDQITIECLGTIEIENIDLVNTNNLIEKR